MGNYRVRAISILHLAFISGIAFVIYFYFFEDKPLHVTRRGYSRLSIHKQEMPWINQCRLNGSIDSVVPNLKITAVLFIHIQKTAGASTLKYLSKLTQPKLKIRTPKPHHSDAYRTFRRVFHSNIKLYNKPHLLTMSLVRNPWARLVSWWAMIHNAQLQRLSTNSSINSGTHFYKYIRRCCPNECGNFTHFIDGCQKPVAERNFALRSIKKDQVSYLINPRNGRWLVDFVGRSETLMDDMDFVATSLLKQKFVRSDFPWNTHKSNHSHYSSYYTDRTARLVGEWYKRDIEMFNYKFERVTEKKS